MRDGITIISRKSCRGSAHRAIALGGGAMTLTLTPLDHTDKKRTIVELDGSEGMSTVQFSFKGSGRLSLEQPAYKDEDIKNKRPPANITAIFVD
jgi:hypothetical protein